MKSIVIVDREEGRRAALKAFLEPENEVLECDTLQQIDKLKNGREVRALFLAWMPGGQEAVKVIQKVEWSPDYVVPVLLLPKNYSAQQVEAEAQQAGDWSKKTFPQARVRFVSRLTAREIQRVVSEILAKPLLDFPDILGSSPEILRLRKLAPRVAASDQAALITGESGSGKQTLARWIHLRSSRGQTGAPFEVYRLCPGIDPALAASELCGHAKGAFPWAANTRRGSLEAANTGTLYIPELSSLPPQAQLQVVKLLENPVQVVERLGSDGVQQVDVRIIAGTRHPLEQSVGNEVSKDLLNHFQFHLHIPPLRSRIEDILLLAEHFLQQAGGTPKLHGQVQAALQHYPWPNNLDELDQALKDALLRSDEGGEILFDHLPAYIQHAVNRLD